MPIEPIPNAECTPRPPAPPDEAPAATSPLKTHEARLLLFGPAAMTAKKAATLARESRLIWDLFHVGAAAFIRAWEQHESALRDRATSAGWKPPLPNGRWYAEALARR